MHKLIIIDLDPPIAVRVELGKRLAELLDDDTRAYEAVERNARDGCSATSRR